MYTRVSKLMQKCSNVIFCEHAFYFQVLVMALMNISYPTDTLRFCSLNILIQFTFFALR